jgi:hypothetical protein
MSIKTIEFYNSTIFPILVEGWKRSQLGEQYVYPNEICSVYSESGEWYINKMFCSEHADARDFWKKMGYDKLEHYLGKFRSEPCARGDYSWMDCDEFDAVYDNGIIVFVQK